MLDRIVDRTRERIAFAKIAGKFLRSALIVRVRRRIRGPRRPGWSERYEALVEMLRSDAGAMRSLSASEIRRRMASPIRSRALDRVSMEDARGASVPSTWITPKDGQTRGVMLYLHGGGYVCGSPSTHAGFLARVALRRFRASRTTRASIGSTKRFSAAACATTSATSTRKIRAPPRCTRISTIYRRFWCKSAARRSSSTRRVRSWSVRSRRTSTRPSSSPTTWCTPGRSSRISSRRGSTPSIASRASSTAVRDRALIHRASISSSHESDARALLRCAARFLSTSRRR